MPARRSQPEAGVSPERWERVKNIVGDAMERDLGERVRFLDRACGNDGALRAEVESLLAREDQASHLLTAPDSDQMAGLLREHHAGSNIGRRIGRFEIKAVLGYGGMGVVYRALEEHPHREVALKVMSSGVHASPYQLRLFRREVDSLARLHHAGIAALYEAGTDDEGRHYFAMELVEGRPLAEYVRATETRVDQRLRIFVRICRAIQYAHQRGVIHRDIKPSNIVIGDDGQPKVLDFGLAKLLEDVEGAHVTTSLGKIHGTLSYMSPEQARGGSTEVDIRSDVYSLGVVLFELLTDRRPYEVTQVALPQAIKAICHEPAPRAGSIVPSLRGDLEIIVDKALAKEPERRYQTADALAEDIERFLSRQPISARRPSAVYHLRKLAARHRVSTALLTVLFLSIVGFGGAMTVLYRRTDREARTSRAVTNLLLDALRAAGIRSAEPADYTVREFLIDVDSRLAQQLKDAPTVEVRVRETLADALASLGDEAHALDQRLAALDVRDSYGLADDKTLGRSYTKLGWLYHNSRQFDLAESVFRKALDLCDRGFGERTAQVAGAMSGLADVLSHLERFDEAERYARQSIDLYRSVGVDDTEEALLAPIILGTILDREGQGEEAVRVLRDVIPRVPSQPATEHLRMLAGRELGRALVRLGRFAEARAVLEPAYESELRRYPPGHYWIADTRILLARCAMDGGKFEKAEGLLKAAANDVERSSPAGDKMAREASEALAELCTSLGPSADAAACGTGGPATPASTKSGPISRPPVRHTREPVGFQSGRRP